MKPVVGALEARRKRIEESVKKAEEVDKRAAEMRIYEDRVKQKAHLAADALVNSALTTAEKLKTETAASARAESAKIIVDAKATIQAEKEKALTEVRGEVANLAVMAAEKILRAKLDEKNDRELIKAMIKGM